LTFIPPPRASSPPIGQLTQRYAKRRTNTTLPKWKVIRNGLAPILGIVLLVLDSNRKPNLTNLQHHKGQQKDHFAT